MDLVNSSLLKKSTSSNQRQAMEGAYPLRTRTRISGLSVAKSRAVAPRIALWPGRTR